MRTLAALLVGATVLHVLAVPVTVGVVQHARTAKSGSAAAVLAANTEAYVRDLYTAADANVSLLVFPEFGLFTPDFANSCSTPTSPMDFCMSIPAVGEAPCDAHAGTWHDSLVNISCAVQATGITTLVDLCETAANGTAFNTALIFGPDGAVLAVYRKMHPWEEKCFQPAEENLVTFTHRGSAPIGVFVCKDILYSTPGPALAKAGVRHFVYSAQIPIVGSAAQAGWSGLYNATLIASDQGDGQSGVYLQGKRITKASWVTSADEVIVAQVEL